MEQARIEHAPYGSLLTYITSWRAGEIVIASIVES